MIVKVANVLILIFILLSCWAPISIAKGLEVSNGKLFFNDIEVPTSVSFINYQKNSEKKILFSHLDRDEYSIVKIISLNNTEFWLFDGASETFSYLNTYPVNFKVRWISSNVFLLERKSMGASVSIVYLIIAGSEVRTSGYIKDFFAFDQENLLIFSWADYKSELKVSNFMLNEHTLLSENLEFRGFIKKQRAHIDAQFLMCEVLFKGSGSDDAAVNISLNEEQCEKVKNL